MAIEQSEIGLPETQWQYRGVNMGDWKSLYNFLLFFTLKTPCKRTTWSCMWPIWGSHKKKTARYLQTHHFVIPKYTLFTLFTRIYPYISPYFTRYSRNILAWKHLCTLGMLWGYNLNFGNWPVWYGVSQNTLKIKGVFSGWLKIFISLFFIFHAECRWTETTWKNVLYFRPDMGLHKTHWKYKGVNMGDWKSLYYCLLFFMLNGGQRKLHCVVPHQADVSPMPPGCGTG
jgi:hypothetical protein